MPENPPGHPGITPHWTSSAKAGVGTAIHRESRVWFTVSHGIIDELVSGSTFNFTFLWLASGRWEGRDFAVRVSQEEFSKPVPN